jgi:hypothetical protein
MCEMIRAYKDYLDTLEEIRDRAYCLPQGACDAILQIVENAEADYIHKLSDLDTEQFVVEQVNKGD